MARYKHTAGLLPDGRVLIAGGSDERDWNRTLSSAEIYDPKAGRFTAAPALNDSRFKLPEVAVEVGHNKLLVDEAVRRFGTIHVLVNNAGGVGAFASFQELSDQDWLDVINLNIMSAVRATRAVLPHMQRQTWGRIINISSESGTQPDAAMPHYNASKAAMNNLTKSLSKAYAKDGILVNTVSPAFIMTPLLSSMAQKMAQEQGISFQQAVDGFLATNRPHIELKRAGESEEVASAVVFLASQRASFITGANLRVDGGSVASV